jgi:ATP-binding cassette, subfamily B, bacterial
MASHRRQKVRSVASASGALPATDSPTTLLPVVSPNALVGTAPTVPLRSIFKRFWPDTRGFRGRLVFGLSLLGVPPALAALGIWLFKILVDDVLTTRDVARFPLIAAAFVAVTVVEGIVSFFDEYLTAWVGERFVLNLRSRVFTHLQRLSLTFFERNQLGDILARLSGDVGAIEGLILSGLNQALTYFFQIVFFAGALFVLDWRLALAALVAAPGFLLLARFFSKRIKAASQEQRRRSGSITAVAEESLHNTALVQAYDRQAHESIRFHKENLGSFTAQMVAIRLEALFAPFTDLLQAVGVLAVIGFGVRELVAGRITLGGLLVFIGYLSQLYGPISGIGSLANSIYAASAGAERIIEVLDTKPEVTSPDDPVPLGQARGEFRLDRVGFRYPDGGRPALAEVSFAAKPGETIAVVGASGAGKSTLLRILLRLHDPHAGVVTLDGIDIRQLRLGDLRANLAVVLQDTLVFDGTVAENIKWGRPDASTDDVVQAARDADAHQFITGLPQGYQTRVGQRGMMLSGGQRQRIALARAMIRNAPVLLLDEPTTGLDAVSTQRVMAPLRRAMAGRTTIVISHNLLTVSDADRIVYLERGRVAGYGTHQELMATAPGYAELYRLHHPEPQRSIPRRAANGQPRRPAPLPSPTQPAGQTQSPPSKPAGQTRQAGQAQPVAPDSRPSPSPRPRLQPTGRGQATGRPQPAAHPAPTGPPAPRPRTRTWPSTGSRPAQTPTQRPTSTQPPTLTQHPTPAPSSQSAPDLRPTPARHSAPRPAPESLPVPDPLSAPTLRVTAAQRAAHTPRSTSAPHSLPAAQLTRTPQPMPVPAFAPRSTSAGHTPQPIPAAPTPQPVPAGLTPQPVPAAPTPQPVPVAAPRQLSAPQPVSAPQPTVAPLPTGRSLPSPRPIPVTRSTPASLPIPRQRPTPTAGNGTPLRWPADDPFDTEPAKPTGTG